MTIRDEDQIRAWSMDYALRLHSKDDVVTPEKVIAEAKKIERYITNRPSATLLKAVRTEGRK